MWRSCLRRSLLPLLSHLRRPPPPCPSSILPSGSASRSRTLSLSRAHTSAAAGNFYLNQAPVAAGTLPHFCNGCGADQLLQRRQHLYLALDDWKEGFSLHKIGLDDLLAGGGGDDSGDELQRLPNPNLRLGFRMVGSHPRFHALGSNIVVTNSDSKLFHEGNGLTLVYDTEMAELDIEHSLPRELRRLYNGVAAGDKLYMLNSHNINNGDLPYLCQTKPDHIPIGDLDSDEEEDMPYYLRPQRRWAWERHPAPPPFAGGDTGSYVSAHALHPDGRTVFVSFRSSGYRKEMGTFSLDTESGEWTRRGDWCLPFSGHAHHDGELGAWVGTRMVYGDGEDCCGYEHLCTCDVPDIGQGIVAPAPAWTVAKEELTFLEAPLKTLGRVLLSTGMGGVFCLVEPVVRQGFTYKSFLGDGDKCLLRATVFRAKYGRNGELVAAPLRPGRSYLVSRYVGQFGPYAFWI